MAWPQHGQVLRPKEAHMRPVRHRGHFPMGCSPAVMHHGSTTCRGIQINPDPELASLQPFQCQQKSNDPSLPDEPMPCSITRLSDYPPLVNKHQSLQLQISLSLSARLEAVRPLLNMVVPQRTLQEPYHSVMHLRGQP